MITQKEEIKRRCGGPVWLVVRVLESERGGFLRNIEPDTMDSKIICCRRYTSRPRLEEGMVPSLRRIWLRRPGSF